MGVPERALSGRTVLGSMKAGGRKHPRHLERLLGAERRQNARDAASKHRLPAAGRPRHQQRVAAGGGDLQRPTRRRLAADVGQVLPGRRPTRPDPHGAHRRGRRPSGEQVHGVPQTLGGEDDDAGDHRGLGCRGGGHEQTLPARRSGVFGQGESPGDGAQPAVEGELTGGANSYEQPGGNLPRRSEEAERDRQIVLRTGLPEAPRREVDHDALGRDREGLVGNAGSHTLTSFLDRCVRQSHDGERRQTGSQVDLDADRRGLEAQGCGTEYNADHEANLAEQERRRCAESAGGVPEWCRR